MSTRGKQGIVQPRLHPTLLLTRIEPSSYKTAMQQPDWLQAMKVEYEALMTNNTWTLVSLPANRQAIGCKWVFRLKQNPEDRI
jgi:histone deacetylase 1/2